MTDYRQYAPRPELRGIVESVWLQKSDAGPALASTTVLPNGRSELILHYADPFVQFRDNQVERMPLFHAVGQRNRPIRLNATGVMRIVIVRFSPGGAAAVFGGQLPELENRIVNLDLIWRPAQLHGLREQLQEATSNLQRIKLVQAFVLARIRQNSSYHFCSHVFKAMHSDPARCRVAGIASELGISRRQLTRRFTREIGLSPKKMLGVMRAQTAVVQLRSGKDIQDVVSHCGYTDQSHLIHDLSAHSGKNPTDLIRHSCSPLQRFFNSRVHSAYRGMVYL